MQLYHYRKERIAAGISDQVLRREMREMHYSLVEALKKERADTAISEAKSADSFAAAFDVKQGHEWDQGKLQREKVLQEEQRREKAQEKVALKLKRLRTEKGD